MKSGTRGSSADEKVGRAGFLKGLRRLGRRLRGTNDDRDRPPREMLRPEFLAGLKRLDLRAKVLVRGFIQGLHRMPRRGFSAEFSDYRTFVAGDDARFIDWRLYARTDRFFVKCFEAETAVRATLVLDGSASMGYRSPAGEGPRPAFNKLEYAATLAAACVFLLQRQRDRVGLLTVGGEDGGSSLPPRSPRSHIRRVLQTLSAVRAAGAELLPSALGALAAHERRRGLVLIFSDGLCSRELLRESLRRLRHRGHDVIFFQVWDPAELEPALTPGVAVRDPETGSRYEPLEKAEYLRRAQEHLHKLRENCLALGCDHQFLLTTTAFDRALVRFLRLRRRRH